MNATIHLPVLLPEVLQALRPKAIQHPAHINWITQFDAAH